MEHKEIYDILEGVTDPEVPVLSIIDLGIVRDVRVERKDTADEVTVTITPTYSGCPAMDVLAMGIRMALSGRGYRKVNIENRISPAWTTDWMSEAGKQKLKAYGIAPPVRKTGREQALFEEDNIECPRCGSVETELISKFGPTSCKSLYKCSQCLEPFEHFKCH